MEYVYAALLLHKLNKEVSEENLRKVISATGAEPDEIRTKALVAALSEVDIDKALESAVAVPVTVAPTATPETTDPHRYTLISTGADFRGVIERRARAASERGRPPAGPTRGPSAH